MPEHSRTFSLDPQNSTGESNVGAHDTTTASPTANSPHADAPQGALGLCAPQSEVAFTIVEHLDLGDISGTFSGRNDLPSVDLRMDSHVVFDDDDLYFDIISGGHIDLADNGGQTSRALGGHIPDFEGSAQTLKTAGWYDSLSAEVPFNGLKNFEGSRYNDAVAPRFDEHSVSLLDHLVDSETASLDNLLHDVPAELTKDGGTSDAIHAALTGGHSGYDTNADELYLQTLLDLLA